MHLASKRRYPGVDRVAIGCGNEKILGFTSIDRNALPGVDIVCDIEAGLPLDDNIVDYVIASHSLENFHNLPHVIAEIWRVCRHGARFTIVGPYSATRLNQANPYHTAVFNEHTPRFWTSDQAWPEGVDVPDFPGSVGWGLGRSDNRDSTIDIRVVKAEYFHFAPYRGLPKDVQLLLRRSLTDVCDEFVLHCVVVKSPVTPDELRALACDDKWVETPGTQRRRSAEGQREGATFVTKLLSLPSEVRSLAEELAELKRAQSASFSAVAASRRPAELEAVDTMFGRLDLSTVATPRNASGLPALSVSRFPETEPDVENQISEAEHASAIEFFRDLHLPMIEMAGIDPQRSRILEIGAGFGQLAYGTLKTITPELYVATDVFPALAKTLAANLPKWTSAPTGAALLDPQDELLIHGGAFNVIQSHSVLHHVLNYRGAVETMYDLLDSPGVLIFCEPCLEAYLLFLTLVRSFRENVSFPPELIEQITALEQYVGERAGPKRDDRQFLAKFGTGDKYIYSAYDLLELSNHLGARLYVKNDKRSMKGNFLFELTLRGADKEIADLFDAFLERVLPDGVGQAYFSDLRQVFCIFKP